MIQITTPSLPVSFDVNTEHLTRYWFCARKAQANPSIHFVSYKKSNNVRIYYVKFLLVSWVR